MFILNDDSPSTSKICFSLARINKTMVAVTYGLNGLQDTAYDFWHATQICHERISAPWYSFSQTPFCAFATRNEVECVS